MSATQPIKTTSKNKVQKVIKKETEVSLNAQEKEKELISIIDKIEQIDKHAKKLSKEKKDLQKHLFSTIKKPSTQLNLFIS